MSRHRADRLPSGSEEVLRRRAMEIAVRGRRHRRCQPTGDRPRSDPPCPCRRCRDRGRVFGPFVTSLTRFESEPRKSTPSLDPVRADGHELRLDRDERAVEAAEVVQELLDLLLDLGRVVDEDRGNPRRRRSGTPSSCRTCRHGVLLDQGREVRRLDRFGFSPTAPKGRRRRRRHLVDQADAVDARSRWGSVQREIRSCTSWLKDHCRAPFAGRDEHDVVFHGQVTAPSVMLQTRLSACSTDTQCFEVQREPCPRPTRPCRQPVDDDQHAVIVVMILTTSSFSCSLMPGRSPWTGVERSCSQRALAFHHLLRDVRAAGAILGQVVPVVRRPNR